MPVSLYKHVELYNTILGQFRARSFVGGDALELRRYQRYAILEGEVGCIGEIVLGVTEVLKYLNGTANIEVIGCSYNASVRKHGNLFRFDDAPHHPHPDKYHRHEFDWRTGDKVVGSPFWVGSLAWPRFDAILERAHDWYWANMLEVPNPDSYPVNLRSELPPWSHLAELVKQ